MRATRWRAHLICSALRSPNIIEAHNLPTQLTNFVGRDEQITDVRELLARNRVTTLTGAGGPGKTRLALQVAAASADEYRSGVVRRPVTRRGPRRPPTSFGRRGQGPSQTPLTLRQPHQLQGHGRVHHPLAADPSNQRRASSPSGELRVEPAVSDGESVAFGERTQLPQRKRSPTATFGDDDPSPQSFGAR
jgi:hypothetical protein